MASPRSSINTRRRASPTARFLGRMGGGDKGLRSRGEGGEEEGEGEVYSGLCV